jgi:hypothetical protein
MPLVVMYKISDTVRLFYADCPICSATLEGYHSGCYGCTHDIECANGELSAPFDSPFLRVTALMCESACCGIDCGPSGSCHGGSGICTCEGNFIGEACDIECSCSGHGSQTGIEAARAAGTCAAGSCDCTGNFIGEACDIECSCSGHGSQTNITAARNADVCSAGSCHCDDSYFGLDCGGRCRNGGIVNSSAVATMGSFDRCTPATCTAGTGVVLTVDYYLYSDAQSGPLSPGEVGTVTSTSGSYYGVHGWYYDPAALRPAAASRPPPPPPPSGWSPCICADGWTGPTCRAQQSTQLELVDSGAVEVVDYDNNAHYAFALSCSNATYSPALTFSSFDTEAGYDYVRSGAFVPCPLLKFSTGSHPIRLRVEQTHSSATCLLTKSFDFAR